VLVNFFTPYRKVNVCLEYEFIPLDYFLLKLNRVVICSANSNLALV
jgi:hypothetical protein